MTSSARPLALKARWVFPIHAPPLADGVLTMEGGRITAVGENVSGRPPHDLGNAAVLPGLINAHTHLELSDLCEPLGEPGAPLPDWIRRVVAWRRSRVGSAPDGGSVDPQWLSAARRGLAESAVCGVVALGDIASIPWTAEQFPATSLDCTVFYEQIGLSSHRAAPLLRRARRWVEGAESGGGGRWRPGLSPHASYSVHPDLVAALCRLSATTRAPLAMHVAESPEELELLRSRSGPLKQMLVDFEAWDPSAIRPNSRPLDYLRMLAGAHRALVIHGNYLEGEEIAFLAARSDRMSVIFCPRTHSRFGHARYRLAEMIQAGVNVAVGTDSRASSPDLSVLEELRFVAAHFPEVAPDRVLRLGTSSAARALGRDRRLGGLAPGAPADLTVVKLPDRSEEDPYLLLLDSSEPVVLALSGGEAIYGSEAAGGGFHAGCFSSS